MNKLKILPVTIVASLLSLSFVNCQDDSYLHDGGTHNPYYDGTIMDFIENFSDSNYFTDLQKVIRIAGLEDVLRDSTVTFFVPTDWSIHNTVNCLSEELYFRQGEDSIKDLRQIPAEVWRKYLSLYIVKDKYLLKDIPQLDTASVAAYPGQAYYSYGGTPMNIGVVYYDANGIKYAGARQILYSYVNDFSTHDMVNAYIATSDIQPTNGAMHVIRWYDHPFGFIQDNFIQDAINTGIIPLDSVVETANKENEEE